MTHVSVHSGQRGQQRDVIDLYSRYVLPQVRGGAVTGVRSNTEYQGHVVFPLTPNRLSLTRERGGTRAAAPLSRVRESRLGCWSAAERAQSAWGGGEGRAVATRTTIVACSPSPLSIPLVLAAKVSA